MSNETENILVITEETVLKDGVVILDIVDIEEYGREGRPVPHAHRYKYRVNKQHFEVEHPEITGARILEKAGLVPVDQYRLRMKCRHGPPEEIKPDQTVHLRDHGIERFIAQPKEVQDGLEARREFTLSAADIAFLESLQLHWETLSRGGRMWVVIYGIPLPAGFHISTTDVAIEIAAGYPTAQLDMAFFHPALQLTSGQPVRSAEAIEQIDGKAWQRWSRHRIGKSVWLPGVDNLEKHFAYMQDWLLREVGQ